jgi:hypothetical protein
VTVSEGRLQAQRGQIAGADVTVTTRPPLLAAAVYGKVPLSTLAADMTIDGDQGVFERFIDFFRLPEKATESVALARFGNT